MPEDFWPDEIDWEDEADRIGQIEDWYKLSEENDDDWKSRAEESYDFFFGDTWDPGEIAELHEKGAPALSINRIQSKVNMIDSMARLNRYEPRVRAETSADDIPTAEILSHVMRQDNYNTDHDFKSTMQMIDAIISGRGFIAGDISYETNFFGTVINRYVDPFAIKFDTTALMPDLSDATYIMEDRWFTVDQIANNWRLRKTKRGKEKIKRMILNGMDNIGRFTGSIFVDSEARQSMGQFKVIDCWHRRYIEIPFVVEMKTGIIRRVNTEDEGIELASRYPDQFFTSMAVMPQLYITVVCCGVELYHGKAPFSSPIIPIFPLFCFHAGGRQDGIVEALKDPQLETNKRRSQMLHLLNQHANTVWIVDTDSLVNGTRWLKEHATEPGLVIEKEPSTDVRREPPGNFPVGLIQLEALAAKDFHDVLGVSPETMPTSSMGRGASGRAIALRQQQGSMMLSIPIDNQRLTRRSYGRWHLQTIQEYYTTERIIRIEGKEGIQKFAALNGKTPDGSIINDVTKGRYGLSIVDEPWSQTNMMEISNRLNELLHQGVPIPPDVYFRYLDIPDRQEVVQRVAQYAQQQSQEQPKGAAGSRGEQNAR